MPSFNNADQFLKALNGLAKKINNRNVNDRLARKCRDIIYKRVKNGYGVDKDNLPAEVTNLVKLKPLSKSYIAYREGKLAFATLQNGRVIPIDLAKFAKRNIGGRAAYKAFAPKLGEFGRPTKSNATLHGFMMKSIQLRYSPEGFQLIIASTSRDDDSGKTNKQVADLYSKDRPFFALTSGEIRILTRELEKIVKEIIAREF